MGFVKHVVLVFIAIWTLPVLAAEPPKHQPQVIERYSVSPGASGSISGSSRSQSYELQPVPGLPNGVSTRSTTLYGGSTLQQSGGIRQSTEYPNGLRVPRQSVQGSYQYQRDE
ncbi:MAG: hypothetical protein A2Y50_14020 [Pseudomonadales bacterium RIFCSPLOWO2_12_59_9]|uniref:hypothetical protein n=1 Tax=Pseudomonas sp. TaxID=306 RepID=UPI0008D5AAA1|nr:MAG: hypothetical protein A2Y50_14020 [Pseudomonadales bacterium RIFCSPLOWO2_12_59_9]